MGMKMRATVEGGVTDVRALIFHPMETGNRKDPDTGAKVARHFIREVTLTRNGDTVLAADLSWTISKNPYFQFELQGGSPGDRIALTWLDDRGATETTEVEAS